MNIKAVFIDIDGTFYDHSKNCVLPQSIEACKKLQANGYKVALCSGRPKEMADEVHVFEMLPWDGYIGCSGGVAYNESMEVIYEDGYSQQQMETMFSIAEEHDLCLYSFGKYDFMTKPLDALSKKIIKEFNLNMPEVRTWHKEKLSAVSVLCKEGFDISVFDAIEGITHTSSTPYCIDFVKVGVNKANGIAQMMKYWGCEKGEYIAFGDSTNDVEMLRHATMGFAMKEAHPAAIEAADEVIGSCGEPSIAHTLARLKLI